MEKTKVSGWLIIHTEGKEKASFELKEGKNFIGRHTSSNTLDIALHDIFVSRLHAALVVRVTDKYVYEYLLADNAEVLGKPSLNGTFVNENEIRIGNEIVKLKDGDTFQVGVTKLVLKTTDVAVDVENAVKLVETMDYKKTIEIDNSGAVLRTSVKKK